MDSVKATLANLVVSGIKVFRSVKILMYKIQNKEVSYSFSINKGEIYERTA